MRRDFMRSSQRKRKNAMVQSADRGMSLDEIVRKSSIEIIPLKGAEVKAAIVPSDTTVSITCSPKFGLSRTLDHVTEARKSGHRVVPHLAARMVEGRQELRDFVRRGKHPRGRELVRLRRGRGGRG